DVEGGQPAAEKPQAAPEAPQPAKQPAAAPARPPAAEQAPKREAQPAVSDAFDVVVLAAGPGGYTAAFRAADLGMRVALIERWPQLGGVFLNVGCIPSKALLHAAKVIEDAEAMSSAGLHFGKPQIDAAQLREWKNKVVGRLTGGLVTLAKQRKVEVIR